MKQSNSYRMYLPWLIAVLVSALAFIAWGQSIAWNFSTIDAYQLFPLLGLLAFSLMWAHYMVGSVQHSFFKNIELKPYFRYTSYAVLVALVLHPGILIYQRFRDGYGLPPGSYKSYVAPSMAWITLLGSVSLLIFLAFELHRWYGKKTWWKYVLMAGDAAMLAVFYHGLRLGGQIQGGWYHTVWVFYGVTLVIVIGQKYIELARKHSVDETTDW